MGFILGDTSGVQISMFGMVNWIWIFKVQKEPVIAFKRRCVLKVVVPVHPEDLVLLGMKHETAGQNMIVCYCRCTV